MIGLLPRDINSCRMKPDYCSGRACST